VFEEEIIGALKRSNLNTYKEIADSEQKILKNLNPKKAKERMNKLIRRKNLQFYQEIKNKHLKKIKSKLYRRKKRKKERKQKD